MYELHRSDQVGTRLQQELDEINALGLTVDQLAADSTATAYLLLHKLVESGKLRKYPRFFSSRIKFKNPEINREGYRYVDTWGWRLIVKIDKAANVVSLSYLSRITDATSPGDTFLEMKKSQLPLPTADDKPSTPSESQPPPAPTASPAATKPAEGDTPPPSPDTGTPS
jgi:hypothetical protein